METKVSYTPTNIFCSTTLQFYFLNITHHIPIWFLDYKPQHLPFRAIDLIKDLLINIKAIFFVKLFLHVQGGPKVTSQF